MQARPEFGRARARQVGEIARRLDHRHVHAKADAEIRHPPLASKAGRFDHAFGAALAETAGDQDAVDPFELMDRLGLGLEHLRIDPVEIDPDIVGEPAMGHRLGQRLIAVGKMGVLADDGDRHPPFGPVDQIDDVIPAVEVGRGGVEPEMSADLVDRSPRRDRRPGTA